MKDDVVTTNEYTLPHYALNRKETPQSLSIIAREVMSGEWGHGDARDKKLTDKGYDLDEVYDKIDEMFGTQAGPFINYDVVITVDSLNVRKGPGMGHYIVCTLTEDRNIYTIVEEEIDADENIWGHLRSGLGWVNLSFTKRVDG
jgi:uncharacterized protein YgiM (DUF1202 family)